MPFAKRLGRGTYVRVPAAEHAHPSEEKLNGIKIHRCAEASVKVVIGLNDSCVEKEQSDDGRIDPYSSFDKRRNFSRCY